MIYAGGEIGLICVVGIILAEFVHCVSVPVGCQNVGKNLLGGGAVYEL